VQTGVWWEDVRERDYSEYLGVNGNIKTDLQEKGWGGMDWIDLIQDRDRWQALMKAAINLRVPKNTGNF
jgi:hypothetical protein